jgi:hypothetical protein
MDDDLDAFFNDVENAVKDVKDDNEEENRGSASSWFVKEPRGDEEDDDNDRRGGPPSKRTRMTSTNDDMSSSYAASVPPVKSAVKVVASSVPVVSILAQMPSGGGGGCGPSLAPPISTSHPHIPPTTSSYPSAPTSTLNGHQRQQPSLIPPPPPIVASDGKAHTRSAAGETWLDPTLSQWPENDFRLFVGNLAKDLRQNHLEQAFSKYPSFHMARVMYDKNTGKSRGYGFVSLMDPKDCARAIREMDQSWLGSRPLKVKLSEWRDREWKEVVKKKGRVEKRKNRHFGL